MPRLRSSRRRLGLARAARARRTRIMESSSESENTSVVGANESSVSESTASSPPESVSESSSPESVVAESEPECLPPQNVLPPPLLLLLPETPPPARPRRSNRIRQKVPDVVSPKQDARGIKAKKAVITHSFWPRIRRDTKTAAARDQIAVVCPICLDQLPVAGLTFDKEVLENHPAVVVACGHVFCRPCLEQAFATQRQLGLAQSCPTCRARMECTRCGLQARMCEVPTTAPETDDDGSNVICKVPLTIPEGGHHAERCMRCAGRDQFIFQVEQGRRGHAANRIEAGFGRLIWDLMDEMEDEREPSTEDDVWRKLSVMFQSRFHELRKERESYINAHIVTRSGRVPNEWS
ncbi:hypothetical protein PT974_08007 [Cladobotryum mycophilum]|uniref:RING-type domain-containing protein n=1 Tax=Cladobotryum mycophilum TaxID=491253 RepID=A0ABR0SD31_9HYPO